jgi:hypothetical protein
MIGFYWAAKHVTSSSYILKVEEKSIQTQEFHFPSPAFKIKVLERENMKEYFGSVNTVI